MLDTSLHRRRRSRLLADPDRRREYELARAEITQMNDLLRELDTLREEVGLSKAQLARDIGRNDAVVRRLFSADKPNPELRMLTQMAARLGVRIAVVRDEKHSEVPAGVPS